MSSRSLISADQARTYTHAFLRLENVQSRVDQAVLAACNEGRFSLTLVVGMNPGLETHLEKITKNLELAGFKVERQAGRLFLQLGGYTHAIVISWLP